MIDRELDDYLHANSFRHYNKHPGEMVVVYRDANGDIREEFYATEAEARDAESALVQRGVDCVTVQEAPSDIVNVDPARIGPVTDETVKNAKSGLLHRILIGVHHNG